MCWWAILRFFFPGPFGERDDQQIFVQKVVPDSDHLFIRLVSTGKRICTIRSVDGSMIISYCVNECDGSSGMGSRPRRYLFTGHSNGCVQVSSQRIKRLAISELKRRQFCQQRRQIAEGGWIKIVFVSVCGNLQHI